jgi:hypothetical protein
VDEDEESSSLHVVIGLQHKTELQMALRRDEEKEKNNNRVK